MECSNCGNQTHGGYCNCMIIEGAFIGAWWLEASKEVDEDGRHERTE